MRCSRPKAACIFVNNFFRRETALRCLHLIRRLRRHLPLKGKAYNVMNKTNNSKLTGNAKTLRKTMTPEEKHLWYDFLKLLPVTINRQKVIGHYIVDFYCASAKAVIELDGSQHFESEKDVCRDAYLQSLGIKVLRYWNVDIHKNFKGVCADIAKHLQIEI